MARVRREFPIYTFHIDFAHHVSNVVYIQWMEALRCELLVEIGLPVAALEQTDLTPVLVSTEISYLQPYVMGDVAIGELWLSELKGASATLEFRFTDPQGQEHARGRQRGLFVKFSTMKPARLTADQRERFEAFLEKD